jgi:hypothetical protein
LGSDYVAGAVAESGWLTVCPRFLFPYQTNSLILGAEVAHVASRHIPKVSFRREKAWPAGYSRIVYPKERVMPKEPFELHVSFKRLLIGLLITVVPISVVGLYAITKSDSELQRTIGTHYKVLAETTARAVEQFVHDRVVNVGAVADESLVVAAAEASNRLLAPVSEEALAERIRDVEQGWNGIPSASIVSGILSSDAAGRLRRYLELDPRFLRITVTDARGVTVAATHKTLDYFQADEEFWQAIHAEGRGAVSVTKILYDEVTKSSYVGVGVPIVEESTGRFIGAVDALVDVSSLFGVVNQSHPPLNLRTTLVTEEGVVISAPDVNLSMKLVSEEFVAVRDSLTTLSGRQTGYVVTHVTGEDKRVIGFADTGLKEDYQNLGWVVLVSQDARAAFASIRLVGRLLGLLALLGLAMVTLLVVYFSLHRKDEYVALTNAEEAPKATAA